MSCFRKSESAISSKNLIKLKDKYDIATINYFYETVFHEDFSDEKLNNILKWNSNPKIAIVGNPSAHETQYVKKAISEINKLNLPIKCNLGDSSDSLSIELFFGDFEEVCSFLQLDSLAIKETDADNHFGLARTTSYSGIINRVSIGIYYTEKDTTESTRYKVVFEEILQSLGIIGDSYNYPSSLFFEGYNPAKSFTPLDFNVLSLLYEQVIPSNYTRKSFERDFSNELYTVNSSEKIRRLIETYPSDLYDDIESCLTKGFLLKHPKEVNLFLYEFTQNEDLSTIEQAIKSINKMSPNINVKLTPSPAIEPAHGIVLVFQQSEQQKGSIQRTNQVLVGESCMFQKLLKDKIVLSFKPSKSNVEKRHRSIVDALYFSLVQMPQERLGTNKLFEVENGNIDFNPRYANLLKLIYSNEFIDGFELGDFRKIKSSIVK